MFFFRIRISGVDAPDCVRAVTTFEASVIETVMEPRTLRLRCGSSLGVFTIVPTATADCPMDPVEVTFTLDVSGIATGSATLTFPGIAFCASFRG